MADVTFTEDDLRNRVRFLAFHAPPHLQPMYRAVLDGVVTSHVLFADSKAMQIDRDRGCVVIVFDAFDGGTGPSGFDQNLLGQLLAAAQGFTVATVLVAEPYVWAVGAAVKTGGVVLLVETWTEHEQAWLDRAKFSRSPENWSLWSTEVAGRA